MKETKRYAWQIKTNFRFGGADLDWGYQNKWFQDNDVPMACTGILCEFYDTPKQALEAAEEFIQEHEDDIKYPYDETTYSMSEGTQTLDIRIIELNVVECERRIYIRGERREDLEDNKVARTILLGPEEE